MSKPVSDYSKLRCPVCKGKLESGKELHCKRCDVTYPVKDGIPIMLPNLDSVDKEQDLLQEKGFYEDMFSDLTGMDDGHCIVYGRERIYNAFENLERGSIIEPGCGGGHHSVKLAKEGFDVTSIDISLNGLRAARKLAQHEGQNILFVSGDIKRLPFEDNQFDICFCSLVLHHFNPLDNILNELSRVTRKKFIAFEVNAYDLISYTRFNIINPIFGVRNIVNNQRAIFPNKLEKILKNNGFNNISVEYEDIHDYIGKEPESLKAKMIYAYQFVMKMFPGKYSKNKFMLKAER